MSDEWLGPYCVVSKLGEGGMGEVYLARDGDLNRTVAVKVLPADVTADAPRVARFEQEARAASALNHPNVCVIHALGRTDDGRRFIAMEHVEGETLRERLLRGRLPLREALDIAIQIASALTAAHAAGIVHRDLKPENVMIRRDRLVKVLDFGLAKLTASGTAMAADEPTRTMFATEPGALVGTTTYMSPEQARGAEVDARTDIWALGVVLYEMVTGRPPFTGSTRSDVLAAILEREPKALTEVEASLPRELQRIVGKALRKDPDQRYQVMKDLLLDLEALRDELALSSSSSRGRAVEMGEPRPSIGSRAMAVSVALFVIVLAAGLAWWWWARPDPDSTGEAVSTGDYAHTRLTFGPGLQTDPTFSPDGKFIAYSSDRGSNFDIWVEPVGGGGEPVQITRSPAQDTQPAWSPDGTTIVFRSERDGGGLYVVPALGGPQRRLASTGQWPSWSRDGSEIFFRLGDFETSRAVGVPARLFAIPLEGSALRELIPAFLRGGRWRWIAAHPRGDVSALGDHRTQGFGFYTVALDERRVVVSRQVPLGSDPAVLASRFAWNAAGTMLYVEAAANNVASLWRVRVDPQTLHWQSAERLTTPSGLDVGATVSPDGTRVAFSRQQLSTRIWSFPIDTEPHPRVSGEPQPLTEDGAWVEFPALSPDGRLLAYQLRRPGIDRTELWVEELGGPRRELLATNTRGAAWSPDGKRVVYWHVRFNRQPIEAATAYRQLGGSEQYVSRWSADFGFGAFDWTPDQRALLGSYTEPLTDLYASLVLWPTSDPEASRPIRTLLSAPSTGFWQGRFSPNGRWISFVAVSDVPTRVGIGIIPADARSLREWKRVAEDHEWADKPRWAADGRTLFFLSRRPGSYFNLWAVRFDPDRGEPIGSPFALTQLDSPAFMISPQYDVNELSISPGRAVLSMQTSSGSIWMVEGVDR